MTRIQTEPNIMLVSPIAMPAKKQRDVRDQKLPADRIVVHITGRSTYINAMLRRRPPLAQIEDYFDEDGRPFAHYSVDPWGRVIRHAPENERPWSQGWGGVGGRERLLEDIEQGLRIVPTWWLERFDPNWSFLDSREASVSRAIRRMFPSGTPNDRSVSIEMIQYQPGRIKRGKYTGKSNYKLTMAQYLAGNMLARDICIRHGRMLPYDDSTRDCDDYMQLLGHEDCDPWGRGTKAGGWDPGATRSGKRFCWDCFLSLDFAQCHCNCVIPTPPMPDWARE